MSATNTRSTLMGRAMPRILRVTEAAPDAWPDTVRQAAAQGFDTVLLPGLHVPASVVLAEVAVMATLSVTTAPADWTDGGPFRRLPAPTLDPRMEPVPSDEAVVGLGCVADVEGLAGFWARPLLDAVEAGAAGVRLVGLDLLPDWGVAPFLAALRTACPDVLLMGATAGLSWDLLSALPARTFDLVESSLPYWDGHSDWLWQELDVLRRLAPVVAEGGTVAHREALAAILAEGWMTDGTPNAENLNQLRATQLAGLPWSRLVSSPGQAIAVLRTDMPDPRRAHRAALAVTAIGNAEPLSASPLLAAAEGAFGPFTAVGGDDGGPLLPSTPVFTSPGGLSIYGAEERVTPPVSPLSRKKAEQAATLPRLAIEAPSPCVDGGRFPARQVVGTEVAVEADIIGDGHDHLAAAVRWQVPGQSTWSEVRMRHRANDRWVARFPLGKMGVHQYVVEAWKDVYDTFVDELAKKHKAGVSITLEVQEGMALVRAAAERSKRGPLKTVLTQALKVLDKGDLDAKREVLLAPGTQDAMAIADDRPHRVTTDPIPVQAERTGAAFASWYEVFPRSLSDDVTRHGTFRDVVRHLPRVQAMGFDVLYFPPFHPIGSKNRKGRNNTLTPAADDPGSPYAIGSKDGGHDALHPELGSIEDFQHLRMEAARHGIELAMDFAIQCSPDHPWLEEHKNWFTWRPDGTIRYAENPPKKYEDIVNVDFYAPGAVPDLWLALAQAVMYWAGQGIKLFRVDNPHTKSLPFWEWMIAEVQARHPDAVFLAEAFTRPKVMYRLAKVGFSQSYTYFTWRDTAAEFREYLTELSEGPAREFFRPHFFVNTPDINPVPLQTCPRSGFLTRAALAATLSGLWGVYNGFELCEATPVPGKEEYLDSEKYQLRAWDWDRPGNIVAEIAQLNAIRKRNPALHSHLGVTFLDCDNDQVLAFEKATPDRSNVLLVVINTNLWTPHSAGVSVPFWRWAQGGGTEPARLVADDLVNGGRETWSDRWRRFSLSADQPYAIWRLTPSEGDA